MKRKGETTFNFLLLIVFGAGIFFSNSWSADARLLPMAISIGGAVLSAGLLLSRLRQKPINEDEEELPEHTETNQAEKNEVKTTTRSEMIIILWILAFLGVLLVLGFWLAVAMFLPVFLMVFGSESVKTAVIYTAMVWIVIYGIFHLGIGIQLYGGILGLSFL